ncbi:MAG: FecR domain-containing protein [Verrucomicrobiota bacterium]|nr:FecR domain-containing protein [Verrucomicrobiota bacterium]MEE2988102.1 FecR domain-containing protein [Verrucomicrobiota bacterium]
MSTQLHSIMKTAQIPLTAFCLLVISTLSSHAAELATAKVLSVSGTVMKSEGSAFIKIGGRERPLKAGDILREGDRLNSTKGSKAILVFSNGSEITLYQNSSLSIIALEQEPYTSKRVYNELEADPSKSQTLLELDYGQLDGHVKKLTKESSFNIKTALGTAAIRGTKFRIRLLFTANKLRLTITNFVGLVDLITQTTAPVISGDIDDGEGNTFDSDSNVDTTPIPPAGECNVDTNEGSSVFETVISGLSAIPGLEVGISDDGTLSVEIDLGGFIPAPEVTPDPETDPGIIVVSPAAQDQIN